MFRIFDLYNRSVASLAVLGDESTNWRLSQFGYELFGCTVNFRFPIIKLLDYQQSLSELEASRNPFATVVMAHLFAVQTKSDRLRRKQQKLALARRLYEQGFLREQVLNLLAFVDWMLIDNGHHSHAFYDLPTAPYSLAEKIRKPNLFLLPSTIKAHLENYFPSLVIFHGEMPLGKAAQCHIFVPEANNSTRTYILLYGQAKHPVFKLFGSTYLKFGKVVVDQDADILGKIYPDTLQKIKLNNEVGMDWVRRNFQSFPNVVEPNLSK